MKSVLLSIPSYFMQSLAFPIGVWKEMERIASRFIWGSMDTIKNPALVK